MTDQVETARVRTSYLDAAGAVTTLLQDPAVATAWDQDSALAKLTVGALAGHLARQVVRAQQVVASEPPPGEPISLFDHYARSAWVQSDLDDEPNVMIRQASEQDAAGGPAAVVARVEAGEPD